MGRFMSVVRRIVLVPFRLFVLLRGLLWVITPIARPVLGYVDSSGGLSNYINQLSSSMAKQRGLLLVVGTGLLMLSLITHGIVVVGLVVSDAVSSNLYWICIPFTLLHVGVMVGFTGAMLAVPLGQGYKDK